MNQSNDYLYYFLVSECPLDHVPISCPNYKTCIPGVKLCDGIDDCGDNVDESADNCSNSSSIIYVNTNGMMK